MKRKTLAYSPMGRGDVITPFDEIFKDKFNPVSKGNLEGADALILWGGEDIHPSYYKEPPHPRNETQTKEPSYRDVVEWELMREAYRRHIPIIGVCRGAQFLCVFSGGKLIQDCKGHYSGHGITTYDGLSTHAAANHHQMMSPKEGTYDLLAWAETQVATDMRDGWGQPATGELIDKKIDPEVLWFRDVKGLAIQPHPEWMPSTSKFNEWVLAQIEHFFFNSKATV